MKTIPEQYLLAFLSHIIIKVPGKTFLLEIIPLDVFTTTLSQQIYFIQDPGKDWKEVQSEPEYEKEAKNEMEKEDNEK